MMKTTLTKLFYSLSLLVFLQACGQGSDTSKEAGEIRSEINQMEGEKPKSIGTKCGEDLEVYIKNVDKLLALVKRKAKEGNTDEIKAEEKKITEDMEKLSENMKEHIQVYMVDQECLNEWVKAQQQYTKYIQENIHLFMPDQN